MDIPYNHVSCIEKTRCAERWAAPVGVKITCIRSAVRGIAMVRVVARAAVQGCDTKPDQVPRADASRVRYTPPHLSSC